MPMGNDSSAVDLAAGMQANANFHTTHWSVVLEAGGRFDSVQSAECAQELQEGAPQRAALERLFSTYWYPIYAFARRHGHGSEEARDLVQSFFTGLLESGDLASAKAERGRFRSFLLTCFQNFAANQHAHQNALKRGGGQASFSLDQALAEERFDLEPSTERDAEQNYHSAWAHALMEDVMQRLCSEYEAKGKSEVFQQLKPMLAAEPGADSYDNIAQVLGVSEGAVKVAAHRLRKRFGEILRREISNTLQSPEDIDDEIRGLFAALG